MSSVQGTGRRRHAKWSDVAGPMTPERRARVDTIKAAMAEGERLYELRKGRGVTQVDLAEAMGVTQGSVSALERRDDLFISTLRGYIEGMGGQLRITAVFDQDDEHQVKVG